MFCFRHPPPGAGRLSAGIAHTGTGKAVHLKQGVDVAGRLRGLALPLPPILLPLLCRQRLHDNRGCWQAGRLLRENLEAVLGVALPQRQGADAEDASADCAICYAYRLPPAEGQLPAGGEEGGWPARLQPGAWPGVGAGSMRRACCCPARQPCRISASCGLLPGPASAAACDRVVPPFACCRQASPPTSTATTRPAASRFTGAAWWNGSIQVGGGRGLSVCACRHGRSAAGSTVRVCCCSPSVHACPLALPHPLQADTSTRQSFNTLFGACPYCSAPITVKAVPA